MSEFRLEAVRFNFPYKAGTERLRREVLHDPGFDPTSLYRFGMMMAMGILEMMKGVEARFGAEGQAEVCHFKMSEATPGAPKAWSTYSNRLAARMLAESGKPIQ